MIKVISNKNQITRLQRKFYKRLFEYFTEAKECRVGFPGGSFTGIVHYSPELDLWVCDRKAHNRFWNAFGHGAPIAWNSNAISVEINIPFEGINKSIAGVFAEDEYGNAYILHRGRLGGKKGVGKRVFFEKFKGDLITAIEGDAATDFFLVCELNTPYFHAQLKSFVDEVWFMKRNESTSTADDFSFVKNFGYTDESSGVIVTENREPIVINRRHGIVVRALNEELKKRGFKTGNDKNRDLFIHDGANILKLFEVKTTSSTQCLYAAIGQLLIYSIPISQQPALIAVLPEKLSNEVVIRFKMVGIEILYYEWRENKPVFVQIDKLLS